MTDVKEKVGVLKAAEKAAEAHSSTLRNFAQGGSVEDQTDEAFKGLGYGELIAEKDQMRLAFGNGGDVPRADETNIPVEKTDPSFIENLIGPRGRMIKKQVGDFFTPEEEPTKEIDPLTFDKVVDFFSRERGLERSKKLEDAIRYYLGPYAGSLGQANQLLNPIVGLQDAGEATREGRYIDAVTDTAAAALPIVGALAAKPLAKSVQSGIDEAVDAVTEVLTGGTGRREVLGTPSARLATQSLSAGDTGMVDAFRLKEKPSSELSFPPPRLEQKTGTSFPYPTQTITLGSPISPYVETMDIPKKGITGKNFLADIRKNLKVPVRVFQDDFIEGNKRYTREELLKLVEEKEFKVKAQEQGLLGEYAEYADEQRQSEAGFTYGDEKEYFFMNIAATTGAGKITPRRQHASRHDIGHVRGSIITPSVSSNFDAKTKTIFDIVTEGKPILLGEEFQSDLYQKGYKITDPKFMQQEIETSQYGRFSKEVQKIIADSSTAANKANIPTVDDYGYIKNNTMLLTNEAIERTMKDATDSGYIGGDAFDSVSFSVDRLKDVVGNDAVFKDAYLDLERIEKTVRRFAKKGINITLPSTESFSEELFITPRVDVKSTYYIPEKSLSNTTPIENTLSIDIATFARDSDRLAFVQRMDSETTEIFKTTTIGELNTATKEWLESRYFLGSDPLFKHQHPLRTNAERMIDGDFISADDIGGRTSGEIGEPGTISEVAENLVRKKLGLDFTENPAEDTFSSRYVNYPDNTEGYFRLINAYSDVIFEQVIAPTSDFNVLGKIEKKPNLPADNSEMETYIAKTARSILKYREKIVDQENKINKHFEKFVSEAATALDEEALTSSWLRTVGLPQSYEGDVTVVKGVVQFTPKQAKRLLRDAYRDLKINTNNFQGLDAVTPPINKVKSVTDEMLKTLIVKAATSGVDKIVIPPTDRIAAVRFKDYKEYPPKFLAIMNKGLPASIREFKTSYPEVGVSYNVEMPYDNSMYPPGSNNIPSNEGTVIDLKEFLKKYNVSPEGEVRQFAQGGVAMRDQMEMNFGKAETRDPVSGNNVPPGSLPEEVRDDIPARLSEGEYVVPADVVRYFGVKFFEDLRMEAKRGLQQMDSAGRIGGDPVPQMHTVQDIDAMIDAEMANMNKGGVIKANHGVTVLPQWTDYSGRFGVGEPLEAPPVVKPIDPVETTIVETPQTCAAKGMAYDPVRKICMTDGGDDNIEHKFEERDSSLWVK